MNTTTTVSTIDRRTAVPAAIAAILIGALLIFGAGLAQSNTLHNAAHDGRHSFAMPCH